MSCQAFCPGGFLKVEPPVRLLIGCVASRDFGDLVHLGGDDGRVAAFAAERGLREDVIVGHAAMPVGEAHVGVAEHMDAAGAIDGAGLDQRVLGLASIGAAVHAQRAADAARNAAQEREPGNAGLLRRARDLDVGHRGAGAQIDAVDRRSRRSRARA